MIVKGGESTMFEVLSNGSELAKKQMLFQQKFEPYIDETITAVIGFHGDNRQDETVHWSEKLGIWMCFSEAGNRYWNPFGIGNPKNESNLSITCEINIPFEGINRRIGGAFVCDNTTGDLYLMHRGTIGGSKKGVGKGLFERLYAGGWRNDVQDGLKNNKKVSSKMALIAAFDSSRFAYQVSQFVHNVRQMKDFISSATFNKNWEEQIHENLQGIFQPEFYGSRNLYKFEQLIQAECDHGIIVNKLAIELKSLGLKVRNDKHRDLYILSSEDTISAVLEIKTDITANSIYKAVGQLMVNNVEIPNSPNLFIVIPGCSNTLRIKLNKLGINVIIFDWNDDIPVFSGIEVLEKKVK